MPTQKNYWGTKPPTGDVSREANVTQAQTNFDGGRTTKKGGGNASKPQMNFQGTESINVKTKSSHFGEKPLTGNSNGY